MAASYPYFQTTDQAGFSTGPSYTGKTTVMPSGPTAAPRNYADLIAHNTTVTIDAVGFNYANFLAMFWNMVVDAVQTGTPTATQLANATVTVHLVDALSGGATDYTIALVVGQLISFPVIPATVVHNVTSITVVGDTNVDCDIYGGLLLTA